VNVLTALVLAAATASAEPLEGRRLALHALNRLGYGPRPGEVEKVAREGVDAWIARQLAPETIADPACAAVTARFKTQAMSAEALWKAYPQGERRRILGFFGKDDRPRRIVEEAAAAKFVRAANCEAQLAEVMTDFWFNHFNVDARKGPLKWLFMPYERDVIRPRAMGRFRDLLGAVAHSPAMLVYLDNAQSTVDARYAPDDMQDDIERMEEKMAERGGKRAKLGLNENYARELLELHTLGVNSGYSQGDVTQLARVLTGWSVRRPNPRKAGEFGFQFKPRMHDPGPKTVLGKAFAGKGEEEGEAALDLLARHPATAAFIATKLCRRFVADDPSPALVARVARRFTESGGDVRAVLKTLFADPEFRSASALRAKVKTPFEYAASLLRATNAEVRDPLQAARALVRLGQPPYLCEPPTGWPDRADAWVSAGGLLERMKAANMVTRGGPKAPVAADPAVVRPEAGEPEAALAALTDSLLGGAVSARTRQALERRLADPEVSRSRFDDRPRPADARLLAVLVLGTGEFQRR
jgi:uncharacterized protein (DUF1800 family)